MQSNDASRDWSGLCEGLGAASEARCMCKDRALSACPGEWEPGCDLGNNPEHVRVYQECAANGSGPCRIGPQGAQPWRADLSGNYPNPRIVDAEGKAVGFAVQRDDWKPGDGITREVAEARALLMAKAPQMMAALQDADTLMGHGDAETAWRERWAFLWPNG